MRIKILILAIILTFTNCSLKKDNISVAERLIVGYIDGLNNSDFRGFDKLFSDSIKFLEGDFILANSLDGMRTHFQWDSVFSPRYQIIDLSISDTLNVVTVSKLCKRIKFLHDTSTVYKINFNVNNGQIEKMYISEYLVFDYKKWISRRDSLLSWIKQNHQYLDGFFYENGINGAVKYSKAIDLFETEHDLR